MSVLGWLLLLDFPAASHRISASCPSYIYIYIYIYMELRPTPLDGKVKVNT